MKKLLTLAIISLSMFSLPSFSDEMADNTSLLRVFKLQSMASISGAAYACHTYRGFSSDEMSAWKLMYVSITAKMTEMYDDNIDYRMLYVDITSKVAELAIKWSEKEHKANCAYVFSAAPEQADLPKGWKAIFPY